LSIQLYQFHTYSLKEIICWFVDKYQADKNKNKSVVMFIAAKAQFPK